MSTRTRRESRPDRRIHGKKLFIRKMYSALAGRYDSSNLIISLGRDRRWRRLAVGDLPRHGWLVDLGGGTGDLTLSYFKHRQSDAEMVLVDFNREMLQQARRKISTTASAGRVHLVLADVERLPFKSSCFSGAMSAFVLRNLPAVDGIAAESVRILRPGERAVFLDATRPTKGWFRRLFDLYWQRLMPRLATIINPGQGPAYRYLARSVVELPPADRILQIFCKTGFIECGFRRLSGGMVTIFRLTRPPGDS